MARVTYTGTSHIRKITAADFRSVGVEDAEAITLNQGESVEVSQAVADYLENNEPKGDWKVEQSAPAEVEETVELPAPVEVEETAIVDAGASSKRGSAKK